MFCTSIVYVQRGHELSMWIVISACWVYRRHTLGRFLKELIDSHYIQYRYNIPGCCKYEYLSNRVEVVHHEVIKALVVSTKADKRGYSQCIYHEIGWEGGNHWLPLQLVCMAFGTQLTETATLLQHLFGMISNDTL